MSKQVSPFAALSGAEKQIRWLEYQSIRLPYIDAPIEGNDQSRHKKTENRKSVADRQSNSPERPVPPPEVPRTMPTNEQRSHHSQYDAVVARLKQAEMQSRRSGLQMSQQS